MASGRDPSQNKYSEQNVLNSSFDKDYDVLAVENLVYNPITDALERQITLANTTASGVIDAISETVECTVSPGAASVGCQIIGTWVGQLEFEATTNGTNWVSVYVSNQISSINATAGNGIFIIASAGYVKMRMRSSAWTSGSASISFNSTVGTTGVILTVPLPQGNNILGSVRIKEVVPTDSNNNNGSLTLGYDGDSNLTTLTKTISAVTYTKTLTWTDGNLTAISVWS